MLKVAATCTGLTQETVKKLVWHQTHVNAPAVAHLQDFADLEADVS